MYDPLSCCRCGAPLGDEPDARGWLIIRGRFVCARCATAAEDARATDLPARRTA